jgi:hypothetical protein
MPAGHRVPDLAVAVPRLMIAGVRLVGRRRRRRGGCGRGRRGERLVVAGRGCGTVTPTCATA